MEQRVNLYNGVEYFTLTIGNRIIDIDEPVGWDVIAGQMERDPDFYGFNIEFVSGSTQLMFAFDGGGGEDLLYAYERDGGDAEVTFEFGIQESTSRFPQFVGTVNLNDKSLETDGMTATVEKTAFESLLRTRYDTKISLNATEDLDGNVIEPPPTIDLALHSKNIVKTTESVSSTSSSVLLDPNLAGAPYTYSTVHYLQPDTLTLITEELEGVQSMPMGVLDHSPVNDSLYQYKAVEAGYLLLNFSYNATERFETTIPAATTVASYFFYVQRATTIIQSVTIPVIVPGTITVRQDAVFNADLQKDDKVYFGVEYRHSQTLKGVLIEGYRNNIEFKQQTVAQASVCKAYRIIDLLNFLVQAVTGKANRVISELYDTGGVEERNAITSGYAIRNFDVSSDKPVQASIKTVLDSLQVLHNIGIGFRTSTSGDYMVVEPMPYFFRKKIITSITGCYDWKEIHDKAHTYNEFDVGFSKYSKDSPNTLDDSNTEQSWLLPIRKYKAKLSKKCEFVTSGYLIEEARREQFKEKPSTSLGSDDDLFLVAYTDEVQFPQIGFQFFDADSSVTFDRPVGLVTGDSFSIQGSVANAGIFFAVSSRKYDGKESFFIGLPARETGTGTMIIQTSINPVPKFAERNQYFGVMDKVIDAGSVYNAKYTCHRLLYPWAPLLGIGLDHKTDDQLIRNTFSKNNGDMTSQFLPSAPHINLGGTLLIQEDADIALKDFTRDRVPFSSSMVQCKAQVDYYRIDQIKKALRGETSAAADYGSVVMYDPESKPWLMCIQLIKYDYTTGTAEFTVNKIEAL